MRMVYVDDDEILLEIAQAFLESFGHTVTCVNDPREARLAVSNVKPDLVLLDVMMPDMDGVQVLGKLREAGALADTPVVFVTGNVEREDCRRLLDAGAAGVIAKPFTPESLREAVTRHYQQWPLEFRRGDADAPADVRILAGAG